MKGLAYLLVFAFLGLGMFSLFYLSLDYVLDNHIFSWGDSHITESNQTNYQSYLKTSWEALPVIVVFAFFFFLVVWAQRRSVDEI